VALRGGTRSVAAQITPSRNNDKFRLYLRVLARLTLNRGSAQTQLSSLLTTPLVTKTQVAT